MDSLTRCSLCTETGTCENRIVTCNRCGLNVHILCYDIKNDDENWMCPPCVQGISESITCELCQQSNGAFKQSACGKWAHIICALFTDGVQYGDTIRMESINLSRARNSILQQRCAFCLKAVGFCCVCSKLKCKHAIHITCAQAHDCLRAITNDKTDTIKLRAFCMDHKPNDSMHRLSSACIQKALTSKTNKYRTKLHMHTDSSQIQMDRFRKSSAKNCAFEMESTETCESKVNESAAQQTTKQCANDEIASTSNAAISNKSFSQFDAIEDRRVSVTSENGSYCSLWWDTCGGTLDIPSVEHENVHKKCDEFTNKTGSVCTNGLEMVQQLDKQIPTILRDNTTYDPLNTYILIILIIFLLFTIFLVFSLLQ